LHSVTSVSLLTSQIQFFFSFGYARYFRRRSRPKYSVKITNDILKVTKGALILARKCTKSVWRRALPVSAGGAYSAPQTPYLDLRGMIGA